ncbi:MAG TPA: fatty acid desaturase [Ramlibacter sp.]|nr:fatty acid desaturase [Ramlibacter sp.]
MKNLVRVVLPFHLLALLALAWSWQAGKLLPLALCTLAAWVLLGIGLEVGTHRLFSHASFKTSPVVARALAVLATLVGQGTVIFWVAIHRGYHHPYADTERDPHSPAAHGLWHSYVGWLADPANEKMNLRASVNLLRDPTQVWLHTHYFSVVWGFAVALALLSPLAAAGYICASVLCFHQTMLVNVACHTRLGSRPYETRDSSRNVWWLAPFTWGLSLHNTHHAHPGDPCFSRRWYEVDPSSWVIRLVRNAP